MLIVTIKMYDEEAQEKGKGYRNMWGHYVGHYALLQVPSIDSKPFKHPLRFAPLVKLDLYIINWEKKRNEPILL